MASCAAPRSPSDPRGRRPRALAFDAFPVFDPRSLVARCEGAVPGRGAALFERWRQRIFAYTWLRIAAGRYRDFWGCLEDALAFALDDLAVALAPAEQRDLARGFLELDPWPDALASLEALAGAGLRLSFLSNFTRAMLETLIQRAGMVGLFEAVISTDEAATFKPDPAAYALGVRRLGLPVDEVLFVAFAGWDAAGASWFGYPTYWVNRAEAPAERLGVAVRGEGRGLVDLVGFVSS